MMRLAFAMLAALIVSPVVGQVITPGGHSHNDYEHARPLADALEQGFASVEADIWLRDGRLLVAHDAADLDASRTLEALYLEPLRLSVRNGSLDGSALTLLIDIKTDGESTYRALSAVLAKYAPILTRVEDGEVTAGRVTAMISGNRPLSILRAEDPRYAFFDGRLSDLGSGLSPALMPLVSVNWTRHFTWTGSGDMPAAERARLDRIVAEANAAGYALRFWATPDKAGPARDALWRMLLDAGVDLVNTDDLAGYAAFTTGQ